MSIEELKNVDVRTVDRDSLVDVTQIKIDDSLPPNIMGQFSRQKFKIFIMN